MDKVGATRFDKFGVRESDMLRVRCFSKSRDKRLRSSGRVRGGKEGEGSGG